MTESTTQKRGALTDKVQKCAIDTLGSGISIVELRLMPYLMYVSMNERHLDPSKINGKEEAVIERWTQEGRLVRHNFKTWASEKFFLAMAKIVHAAYVEIND